MDNSLFWYLILVWGIKYEKNPGLNFRAGGDRIRSQHFDECVGLVANKKKHCIAARCFPFKNMICTYSSEIYPLLKGVILSSTLCQHTDPDYSCAYVIIKTDAGDGLEGHGPTFTIGRGTEVGEL